MPSGRPRKEVDTEILSDLLLDDWDRKDIARELGITAPTLSKRIVDLKKKEGEILQYRTLQSLELTEIEAQILDAVTPDKIREASLRDLMAAFKILKDKELVMDGKPSEIRGLVGYLMHLEKEESREETDTITTVDSIEAEFVDRGVEQEELQRLFEEAEEDGDLNAEDACWSENADEKHEDYISTGSTRRPFPLNELPDL